LAVIAACCIHPTCILAFARKNIAQKNGDWHILLFVLLANLRPVLAGLKHTGSMGKSFDKIWPYPWEQPC